MILAIDQGTTGTTCLVFDRDGQIRGRAYSEFRQHFPRPGWVEHDPNEIWEVTRRVASHALADARADTGSLDAIGITNQRETVVAWDQRTGEPVSQRAGLAGPPHRRPLRRAARGGPRRAGSRAHRLGHRPLLLRDQDRVAASQRRRGRRGGLRDDRFLARRSSSPGATSPTSPTPRGRCSSTSAAARWDPDLCALLGIDPESLPEPLPSAHEYGATAEFGGEVPVAGIAGDQQAALFGQACHQRRDGEEHVRDRQLRAAQHRRRGRPSPGEGLVTTIAWGIDVEDRVRARGGGVRHRGGGAMASRRARPDRRGGRDRGAGRSLDSNDDVYFVPGAHRPRLAALGSRTRAARSSASPAGRPEPTSRGPRWRRSPTRRSMRCAPRRRRPGSGSPSCGPTAARSPTAG